MTDDDVLAPPSAPWVAPEGHADIAPSRFERIENDGYHTIDAHWIVPALLNAVPITGWILEPAAGRGHISRELIRIGLKVRSFDLHRYDEPLAPDIRHGDIRELKALIAYDWVVTNLPYSDLDELAGILIRLGARDRCNVALLVRHSWLVPKARDALIDHPHFAGEVVLKSRPMWMEEAESTASPRHDFSWAIWTAEPRQGDVWRRRAGVRPKRDRG